MPPWCNRCAGAGRPTGPAPRRRTWQKWTAIAVGCQRMGSRLKGVKRGADSVCGSMAAAFQVLVLGSGPAGEKAAIQAAKLRRRVAIVDGADCLGGNCVHTATIPSKTLRETIL